MSLHFLPGQSTCCKFYWWCKKTCKNGSVLMRQPPVQVKHRRIAFVSCFGLPSVWQRSTTLLRIHPSHSCTFLLSRSRILASLPISQRPLPLNGSNQAYGHPTCQLMLRLQGPLRVFRVFSISSEDMPLTQAFAVTSHILSYAFATKAFRTSSRAPPASLESPQSKSSGLGPSFGGLTRRAMTQKTCYSLGCRVAKFRGGQPSVASIFWRATMT